MRLLQHDGANFNLVEHGHTIPPYAILSHTWGEDHEEVSFKDLASNANRRKTGYQKLQFCANQAANDGLEHFWVDTCCIDKSNDTELSTAINSMFEWYRNATKCYVYLSDVSTTNSPESWPEIQKSRWFTRGWTLQELLAPASVEFFSIEGHRLGNKDTLQQIIHGLTGIPIPALQGSPLSQFSISERMSWIAKRKTKCEEDAAYSLLGIFNINMPLVYGEGRDHALKRLRRKINANILPPAAKSLLDSSVRFSSQIPLRAAKGESRGGLRDAYATLEDPHIKEVDNELQEVSYRDFEQRVDTLLEQYAASNTRGEQYGSALQEASYRDQDHVVRLLLKTGANVDERGGYFGNALQAAAYRGHEQIIHLLLDAGADINARGGELGSALQAATVEGKEKIVKLLLENNADINATGGYYGNALQAASARGHERIVKLLLDVGAYINARGGTYGSALQAATAEGNEQIVKLLLESNVDINLTGGYYGNALQAATKEGNEKIVKLLLENNVDINATGGHYGNALQAASARGHERIVKLLLDVGAYINARGGTYGSALQAATAEGNEQIVKLLLKSNADINVTGGYYGNALQAASARGHERIVKLLLDIGAYVNARCGTYGSALQAATAEGNEQIVKLLLESNADINMMGGYYGNALRAATSRHHQRIVRLLQDAGAGVNARGGKYGNAQDTRLSPPVDSAASSPVTSGSGEYNSSSMSCDAIENSNCDVIEELMDHFYAVFGVAQSPSYLRVLQSLGDLAPPSPPIAVSCPLSSDAASSKNTVASAQETKSSGDKAAPIRHLGQNKRPREDDGHDDEDDHTRKRVPIDPITTCVAEHKKRTLACHFLQRDPSEAKRTCFGPGPGWETIHRLKEHIYKKHVLPPTCPRCYEQFKLESSLEEHQRALIPCQVQRKLLVEGINKFQESQLRSKKRGPLGGTDADKWREIYLILFPGTNYDDIPSPYFQLPSASSNPRSSETYVQANLPRLVRKSFERRLASEMGPIAKRLKQEMEEIVRDCISQLTKDYEKQVAGLSSVTSSNSSPSTLTPGETSEPSPSCIPQIGQPCDHRLQESIYPKHSEIEDYDSQTWVEPLWASQAAQEILDSTSTQEPFDPLMLWAAAAGSTSEMQDWNNLELTTTQAHSASDSYEYPIILPNEPAEFTGMMSDIPSATPPEEHMHIEIEYAGKGKGRTGD